MQICLFGTFILGPRQVGVCRNNWLAVWQMSELCGIEWVPMKRAVRDLVALIGNHTSKSEASIQSVTALNAGETVNSLTDRLEAIHQRGYKDERYFGYKNKFETKTSVSRRRRIAQMLERSQSLLQYCNVVRIARLVFY